LFAINISKVNITSGNIALQFNANNGKYIKYYIEIAKFKVKTWLYYAIGLFWKFWWVLLIIAALLWVWLWLFGINRGGQRFNRLWLTS